MQVKGFLNPVDFEIVKNGLATLTDEMIVTIIRTARSTLVKDAMDFSAALCDAKGQVVAQGLSAPAHHGALPDVMDSLIGRYGQSLCPGDIYALNDPYDGGMHLPDIFLIKPMFIDDELLAFLCTCAHHADIGGRIAGGNASDSTEIYQEGLRIPMIKLYDRGVPNEAVLRMIATNVRLPIDVIGDMNAQMAAISAGERELSKLVSKYGQESLRLYMDELLDYAERATRAEIRTLPDGVYEFLDYIDDDGFNPEPIPIKVTITVAEDSMIVDFTGTSRQVKGAINSTLSYAKSNVYLAIRCAMSDPDIPNNGGFFRAIKITAPKGTVVNPVPPAPVAARGLTGFRVADAVFGALAKIVPDRVFAAGEGGNSFITIAGYRKSGEAFVLVDPVCASWGGGPDKDGPDGINPISAHLRNIPVEEIESRYPILTEEYGYVPDTGGPGKFRGGLATVRAHRLRQEEATLQVRSDRQKFPPYGLRGGQPGSPSRNFIARKGEYVPMPPKFLTTLKNGEVFKHVQAGAGGYGNPLERDVQKVLDDVRNEKVSVGEAKRSYGVVIDPATLEVDDGATEFLRSSMAQTTRSEVVK